MFTVLVFLVFIKVLTVLGADSPIVSDVGEMIKSKGYPFEAHQVQTEDGYLLTMHRIPYGLSSNATEDANKLIAFLMHGMFTSSADWIVTGPEFGALGYLLADNGYDVWMGNARGTKWSRKHISLDPDNVITRDEYWDFSWHEISIYDVPAKIAYFQKQTNQTKFHFIGHSQGLTNLIVLLSLYPKYNEMILSAHGMSPTSYLSNTQSPVFLALAPLASIAGVAARILGADEFFPSTELFRLAGSYACNDSSLVQPVCANVLFLIGGRDSQQLNRTQLPAILANTPAGISTKNLVHWEQLILSERFCQFDRGLLRNLAVYGATTPPGYPVEQITTRINLYYALNDLISDVKDVNRLKARLSNVETYQVPLKEFEHLDFLYAIDKKTLVYDKIIEIMSQNNPTSNS